MSALAASGCIGPGVPRYTSQDLALLPCETGADPIFFHAIEFTAAGDLSFPAQLSRLQSHLQPPLGELVVFVHGWNKNPSLAEHDYQDFICRMHGYIRGVARERALWPEDGKGQRLLVLGVFWPSTVVLNGEDPLLAKPVSYFRVRDRADRLAVTGLRRLLDVFASALPPEVNLHLIGHSFGGRMLVRALRELHQRQRLPGLIERADAFNVVLLNAALPAADFVWLQDTIRQERQKARRDRPPRRFSLASDSGVYNVHSFHDSANRYLFRLAALFSPEPAECAAGACGVPQFTTLCVDDSGELRTPPTTTEDQGGLPRSQILAAWNVDATAIVFEHSDIYKGRLAKLVVDLLLRRDREELARLAVGGDEPAQRCSG
jgi:pimeloyl-ACP methyl ester carboxylesterase